MKKVIALILCVISVSLFAACADKGDQTTSSQTEPTATQKKTTSQKQTTSTTEKHVHVYGEWVTVKEPGCTNEGEEARYCKCGAKETETLDIVHDIAVIKGYEATENEPGLSDKKYCSACGTVLMDHAFTPPTGWGMFECIKNKFKKTCSISGMGTYTGDILYIPPEIDGYTVTSINEYTFSHRTGIKEVYIPGTVKVIEQCAFKFCDIRKIHLSEGITEIARGAFESCYYLDTVTIPESVKIIGSGAFLDCRGLFSVTVSGGVEKIETEAFYNCGKLVEVVNNSSIDLVKSNCFGVNKPEINRGESKSINRDGFIFYLLDGEYYLICYVGEDKDITLPVNINGSVYKIYDYAFMLNQSIESVTIPEGITYVGKHAFESCYNLKSVRLPSTLTSLSKGMFINCFALEDVNIPGGVTVIPNELFSGCASLKNIAIPEGVTEIGVAAFSSCESIEQITLPSKITYIPERAFQGCDALKEITVPNGVTEIGKNAFEECAELEKINLPISIKFINDNATLWSDQVSFTYPGTVKELISNVFLGRNVHGHLFYCSDFIIRR